MADSPSRIWFINRFFWPDHSATSQILTDLAFDMAERKLDVHVIASRLAYDDPSAKLPAHECVKGVTIHRVATTRFGRSRLIGRACDYASFYVSTFFAAMRMVGRGETMVVKTDPPMLSIPLGLVARLKGARQVNWLQDVYPELAAKLGVRLADGMIGRALGKLRNRSLTRANTNVMIGERMAEFFEKSGGGGRRQVIHNFTADDTVVPIARDANPLRRSWGYGAGDLVVGYSGNLGRAHDLATMLGAARELRDRNGIRFLFVGGGHLRSDLEAIKTTEGLSSIDTRPYQPRDQLPLSMSVPDVQWLSLRPELEGMIVPSKFYSAAAAGRPVIFIGDSDGEVARMIQRGNCGWTFAPGDSKALAATLGLLADDPAAVAEKGRNARALIDREFTRARAFDAWHALLTE